MGRYQEYDMVHQINIRLMLVGLIDRKSMEYVDGIYDCDPEKNKKAKKFHELKYDDAISKNLKIMDSTAFTLSKENKLPIIVFDINKTGNLKKIIQGKIIGTKVN